MKAHLVHMKKLMVAHKAAFDKLCAAHTELHEHCAKTASKAGGESAMLGHAGAMAKACETHKAIHDLALASHGQFHAALGKAHEGLSVTAERHFNQNINSPFDRSNDEPTAHEGGDTNSPGQIMPGKASSIVDPMRLMKALSRMPGFNDLRKAAKHVNPNSLGNPHFGR